MPGTFPTHASSFLRERAHYSATPVYPSVLHDSPRPVYGQNPPCRPAQALEDGPVRSICATDLTLRYSVGSVWTICLFEWSVLFHRPSLLICSICLFGIMRSCCVLGSGTFRSFIRGAPTLPTHREGRALKGTKLSSESTSAHRKPLSVFYLGILETSSPSTFPMLPQKLKSSLGRNRIRRPWCTRAMRWDKNSTARFVSHEDHPLATYQAPSWFALFPESLQAPAITVGRFPARGSPDPEPCRCLGRSLIPGR